MSFKLCKHILRGKKTEITTKEEMMTKIIFD